MKSKIDYIYNTINLLKSIKIKLKKNNFIIEHKMILIISNGKIYNIKYIIINTLFKKMRIIFME